MAIPNDRIALFSFLACLFLVAFLAIPAWAQMAQLPTVPGPTSGFFINTWGSPAGPGKSNLKAGPLEIHPFLGVTETYGDNIYRSYGGKPKESDWVTTASPGVQLRLPVQRHSLQLDYRADVNIFVKNTETNFVNQNAAAAVNLAFAGGLNIIVSDSFADAVIPRKGKEVPGVSGSSDPFRAMPYDSNNFTTRAIYRFLDRWSAEVRYSNDDFRYKHFYDEGGTSNRNNFGGTLYYKLTPRTDALLDYTYSITDYKTSDSFDNKTHSAYLGLSFDPTAKLRGYIKLGFAEKVYDQDLPTRKKTFTTFSALSSLSWTISPHNILSLIGTRLILEDLQTNAPYTYTDVNLGYRYLLTVYEKLNLNANVGYGTLQFQQPTADIDNVFKTRDDKRIYGGAGIGYIPQPWLSFNLGYMYIRNSSNFINYDFTENKVFLNATIAL